MDSTKAPEAVMDNSDVKTPKAMALSVTVLAAHEPHSLPKIQRLAAAADVGDFNETLKEAAPAVDI